MGHSRPHTTQQYTDEVELDELAETLERAAFTRGAQASPDLTTLETDITAAREELEWRRRESNPRPRKLREERLQACPAIQFRPPAGSQAAHRRASHPLESRFGRLALPRQQAR